MSHFSATAGRISPDCGSCDTSPSKRCIRMSIETLSEVLPGSMFGGSVVAMRISCTAPAAEGAVVGWAPVVAAGAAGVGWAAAAVGAAPAVAPGALVAGCAGGGLVGAAGALVGAGPGAGCEHAAATRPASATP